MTTPRLEVLPRDLEPYRKGNTGIDWIHRIDSGRPGPNVMINALTHGNEFCGMVAATHLLDREVRPLIGTMTVSFANVEAYRSFDPARPFESRQLVHNLNRIWSSEWLDGPQDSPELRRAREMRPAVAQADHILDLHSTSQDVQPFWVYPAYPRNAAASVAIGRPNVHLVMPSGLGSGTPLIQHGAHGQQSHQGVAMVAECGQHFLKTTSNLAIEVALDFLAHFGLIERELGSHASALRYELIRTHVVKNQNFRFTRPLIGFETFNEGELIAIDGDEEVHAPCANCTVLMPTREPIVGREGVYLTRPLN